MNGNEVHRQDNVADNLITEDWCFMVGGRTGNVYSQRGIKNLRVTGTMAASRAATRSGDAHQ